MQILTSASRTQSCRNSLAATLFLVSGAAGIMAGGMIWGLLGFALVLFAVWMISDALQNLQLTREIERIYRPTRAFVTSSIPAPQEVTVREQSRA